MKSISMKYFSKNQWKYPCPNSMKIVFKKDILKNKILYNFKEIIGDEKLLDTLPGSIYIGVMNLVELKDAENIPLYLVQNGKVIGLFLLEFCENQYKPISQIGNETIEIILEDGKDLTSDYKKTLRKLFELQEKSNKKNEDKIEEEKLKTQLQKLQLENYYIKEVGKASDYNIEETIQELKTEKKHYKKILLSMIGIIGLIGLLQYFKNKN